MSIHNKFIVLATLYVVVWCGTVSVDSGDTAQFKWQTTVANVEIHYEKEILVTIFSDNINYNDVVVKPKFGSRLKVVRNGDIIQVTITDAKSSDEGDYKAFGRPTAQQLNQLGLQTLVVNGLSSSDVGMIIGIVVGVILLIIIIIILIVLYKRKQRRSERSTESSVPMNQRSQEKKEEKKEEENHYDQFTVPPSNKKPDQVVLYSELGPGGGRVGPKDGIVPTNYAMAKY